MEWSQPLQILWDTTNRVRTAWQICLVSLTRSPEQPQVSSLWEGVTSGMNARRYSFKLCAAMLLSKQLLWHFSQAALPLGFRFVSAQRTASLRLATALLQLDLSGFYHPVSIN
ncbi:hypothetical protein [Nostoc sp. DSM 114161]|uniref:hypothetical protein n=1 Tax=Nostoc sp. DSM 114161 TaxID=3440143 RepID=UPI0040452F40